MCVCLRCICVCLRLYKNANVVKALFDDMLSNGNLNRAKEHKRNESEKERKRGNSKETERKNE